MRCQFCGWDNPHGKEICEKCNKPLTSSVAEETNHVSSNEENHNRPTDRHVEGTFNPKVTVREIPAGGNVSKNDVTECPECGYPLENGECSACGYKVGEVKQTPENVVVDPRKTIRPIRKGEKEGEFKLVPISEETGMPEGKELSYEGNTIVLNRENTDPKNSTITSQDQASIAFENGKWSIEDKSEYKTTFVQATRKIELQRGDLILLGNQLYRFEL